jgi:hypothetical protein
MRLALPLAVLAVVLSGCPNYVPYLPDGGRARLACDDRSVAAAVKILDRDGEPAAGATLTVDYLDTGDSDVLTADHRGVVVVKHPTGVGTARVQGQLNSQRTPFGELNFVGTECSSAVTPRELFLQLQ